MEVPVYKITIKEDDINSGVDYVALVDSPAILRNFLAFKKEAPEKLYFLSEEKREVTGPVMIPDIPIYRRDAAGEFYVVFDRATIYQIWDKFMLNQNGKNVNIMHQPDQRVEGVHLLESYFINSERGVNTPKGFEHLPDGSIMATYRIKNDEVWAQVKDGTFKGFSVEGFFDLNMERVTDDTLLKKVIDIIKGGKCYKENKTTLTSMDAKITLQSIKKLLFGEKFMDAVLKGSDGNEVKATIDGELVPGVAVSVDGKPIMDGTYEMEGSVITCQGGLIVTVTPVEKEEDKKVDAPQIAEVVSSVATLKEQLTSLEAKLSEVKPFDSTELKTAFDSQINELKGENKILTDSVKQLLQFVESLSAQAGATPVAPKKDAFKIQKENQDQSIIDLAATLNKLSKTK